ncbi:pterin-4-alpha-carbinolamine dehydratase [Mariprofundus aestuarium]|uniref:Putative pterin-4-alpha-carbinolamine dehydratase n=1 Tax=Mariprofundus aestuarium TaxID=1921086 RepID=A0A2K8KVZ6_MARES|nr:4a-hydroxytetrahydrobiopterin dehydratase [Mariprofundus aestuarium]ATX78953.1 pterin-4-alpha-carbinolamine dehydratase [Mariprofundus aestuarium]
MNPDQLKDRRCKPCQGGVAPMGPEEAQRLLVATPGWDLCEDARQLRRSFTFNSFVDAQLFAVAVGEVSEEEGHHPDITYGWGYCTVTFYTHKIGGLHENDYIMAAKVNQLER